jgi:hypothetical protein
MTECFSFDPSTGARNAGFPAPGAAVGSYHDASGRWTPSDAPQDPHCQPFEVGDEPPTTGPVPDNIVAGPVPGPLSSARLDQ